MSFREKNEEINWKEMGYNWLLDYKKQIKINFQPLYGILE
jgi:hypothetical protein